MNRWPNVFIFLLVAASAVGQTDSITQFRYPNGILSSEGILRDGKPDGFWKTYYQNAQLKSEGNRVDFELSETWKFYSEEGVPTLQVDYEKGLKNGEQRKFHKGGNLKSLDFFLADQKDSVSEYYSEENVLIKTVPFEDGKESGPGYSYDEKDGRIIGIITYRNGFIAGRESFNRKDKFNQKQGISKEFYPSMILKIEGKYKNDKRNGYFKEYDEEGNLLETLKYKMDVLIPDPEELAKLDIKREYHPNAEEKHVGSYSKGLKEGVHRSYDLKGNVTAAQIFRKGEKLGDGIMDDEGRRQGYWKEYYPGGGLKREGKYKDGKREGPWKFYYADGSSEQLGTYKDGKPDGDWNWFFPNGNTWRSEIFYAGLEEGMAIEYNDTGKVISQGNYLDGEKEGVWIQEYGDHKELGKYIAGLRDEEWKHFHSNGELIYKGTFVDGREDGKHTEWYESGKIREEGKFSFGSKEGIWVVYDELGEVTQTIIYRQGQMVNVDGVPLKGAAGIDGDKENVEP